MALSIGAAEPADCWRLVGVDDVTTPPTVSRVLNTVGSREEWRRAGVPVLFDESGDVRPLLRGGREYLFERVDGDAGARERRCAPLVS
jgi:hypothetical protein